MIFSKLNPFAFVLAFGAGLMVVYVTNPRPTLVVKFPTPMNAGKVIYRENGECYVYKHEEVDCDSYSGVVRDQPIKGIEAGAAPLHAAA